MFWRDVGQRRRRHAPDKVIIARDATFQDLEQSRRVRSQFKISRGGGDSRQLVRVPKAGFQEPRGCNGRPLKTSLPQLSSLPSSLPQSPLPQSGLSEIIAERRGSTHFYFAQSAEQLAPLMREYEDCETYIRPSNLEDVFLRLTDRERLT